MLKVCCRIFNNKKKLYKSLQYYENWKDPMKNLLVCELIKGISAPRINNTMEKCLFLSTWKTTENYSSIKKVYKPFKGTTNFCRRCLENIKKFLKEIETLV